MIDIEPIVITEIKNAVESAFISDYPDIKVYSYEPPVVEKFPCVCVVENDNYTYKRTQEFGKLTENNAVVTFRVSVYTNNSTTPKAVCKKVFGVVDSTLQLLKATRIMAGPVENIDRTIARRVGLYEMLVGEGITTTEAGVEITTYPAFRY